MIPASSAFDLDGGLTAPPAAPDLLMRLRALGPRKEAALWRPH
jgi:hypothetical protein